jgi:transketolase
MSQTAYLNAKFETLERKATRDGYGDALVELGKENQKIVAVCADVTESTRMDKFRKEFPNRFFEMGVAEQNMAGVAAGLALAGKIPFMASYGVFNPGRNWDLIRVSIAYSKANVKIVGSHQGLTVGPDGATHQAFEDIALMRVLPNIVVLNPTDYFEAEKAVRVAVKHEGPVYIRLAREKTPILTTKNAEFKIGRAYAAKKGNDVTLVATGPVAAEVIKAAKTLATEDNIRCEVIFCPSIKPLDEKTILESAKKTRRVVTIEEHQIAGGFGSAVCEFLSQEFPVPTIRMGINDSFGESGAYNQLLTKYGLDEKHIVTTVKNFVHTGKYA